MSDNQPAGTPAMRLEHAAFPHLTSIEWQALHRLVAVAGEVVITSLLCSATPDQHHQVIQELMMETSSYSGTGPARLPQNHWFSDSDITISSKLIEAPSAKVNFLLSRLSDKAKEWTLGKLVVDQHAFPTLETLQSDLRLALEPPQGGSLVWTTFFALKQGKMSMRDYAQKARHLASGIVTKPIDVLSQVHIFVSGMRKGMTRHCLTRAEPATLEVAFALALREDYVATS
ncbi:Putative Polyprotein [Phytophthora palmivora]|uniref:Polyprotein n=1 Tax=Phytophthora palmivora TaxID=4796 RepID=A0A2P4XFW8_9STRA|nr:Putative Polyprotein [Phytophthora palmivora]